MKYFYAGLKVLILLMMVGGFGRLHAQVEYSIRGMPGTTDTYIVAYTCSQTWGVPMNYTSSAQLTIRVPHGTGADEFNVTNLTPLMTEVEFGSLVDWRVETPVRAPTENPTYDYISFQLDDPGVALPMVTAVEQTLFTFVNSGNCISNGALGQIVTVMDNANDPFSPIFIGGPNSRSLSVENYMYPLYSGGANAFSNIYLSGNTDCSVSFPVEWLDFTATPNGAVVDLEWATAIETNNDYFSVERSADGTLFEEITRVAGSGTTAEVKKYFTVDEFPIPGKSYYRLRQVDYDGGWSHSDVVEVNFDPEAVQLSMVLIPNHISSGDDFEVSFSVAENQYMALEIYLADGRLVYSENIKATKGLNRKRISGNTLAAGLYHVRVFNEHQSNSKKLVVY